MIIGSQGFHTGKIGSSLYVSPEQLTDANYDEKVDIYSLGVILFELYIPFGTEMERIEVIQSDASIAIMLHYTNRY